MAFEPYSIQIEREAEEEFLRAMKYFAKIDRDYGLGPILTDAFDAEIDQALQRAAINPRQFPRAEAYHRLFSGNRFRYVIYFAVDEASRTIWVKAIQGPGQERCRE